MKNSENLTIIDKISLSLENEVEIEIPLENFKD
jgi:hypothetical protein